MVRSMRHGFGCGLTMLIAAAGAAPAAAQVPPGTAGNAVPVVVGAGTTPAEIQAWDARIDGMIRTGELVVMSRTGGPGALRPDARVRGPVRRGRARARGGRDAAVRARRHGVGARHAAREPGNRHGGGDHGGRGRGPPGAADGRPAGRRLDPGADGAAAADRLLRPRLRRGPRRRPLLLRRRGRRPPRARRRRVPAPVGDRHRHRDPRRPQEDEHPLRGRPVRGARPASSRARS